MFATRDSSRRVSQGRLSRGEARSAYLFLLPTLVGFTVFVAIPILASILLSLFSWDVLTPARFVGLSNYHDLVNDPTVGTTLANTIVFSALDVSLQIVVALILAVLVNVVAWPFLRTVFRSIIFFPVIVSAVAVGLMWQWLMSTDLGIINYYLGLIGSAHIPWLTSNLSLGSLVLVDSWRGIGFAFVVFTAGLQSISKQYYEAADVDGANAWQKFWRVTLPLLSPTTFFLVVIILINAFQFFDLSYVMTQGGPGNATRTIVFYIYDTAFHLFKMGYASTISLLLLVIIGLITFVQMRIGKFWVFYQ
jgi:multiple sugar transport system permease protein